jgi:hypothetical protein
MPASVAIAFCDDPARTSHVEVAFGRSPGRRPWARATVFSGPSRDWESPARDAAAILSGLFPRAEVAAPAFDNAEVLPVLAPECWAAALAHADAARAARVVREAHEVRAVDVRALFPPEPAASAAVSAGEVFAQVDAHARQYGSHPSFRDPKSTAKANNYIVSVYGMPLPLALLKEVRERLARQ